MTTKEMSFYQKGIKSVCLSVFSLVYDKNTFSLIFYKCRTFTFLYIVKRFCFLQVSREYSCSLNVLCFVMHITMHCAATT